MRTDRYHHFDNRDDPIVEADGDAEEMRMHWGEARGTAPCLEIEDTADQAGLSVDMPLEIRPDPGFGNTVHDRYRYPGLRTGMQYT